MGPVCQVLLSVSKVCLAPHLGLLASSVLNHLSQFRHSAGVVCDHGQAEVAVDAHVTPKVNSQPLTRTFSRKALALYLKYLAIETPSTLPGHHSLLSFLATLYMEPTHRKCLAISSSVNAHSRTEYAILSW